MVAIVHRQSERRVGDEAVRSAPGVFPVLSAEILPGLGAAEALWRAFEAAPDCLASPYQRFAWSSSYLSETGDMEHARVAILRDQAGRVRMLMPLVVQVRQGLTLARSVGDTHANYHLPLFTRDTAAVPAEEVRAALVAAGAGAGSTPSPSRISRASGRARRTPSRGAASRRPATPTASSSGRTRIPRSGACSAPTPARSCAPRRSG